MVTSSSPGCLATRAYANMIDVADGRCVNVY